MNGLSGREKFEQCGRKGYRSCPEYNNPIMKQGFMEDFPGDCGEVNLRAPSPEDEKKAAKLCESCDSFRPS